MPLFRLKAVVHPTIALRTRWWFQFFFIFTPTRGNDPNWLIFFRWVETTNQMYASQAVQDGIVNMNIEICFATGGSFNQRRTLQK